MGKMSTTLKRARVNSKKKITGIFISYDNYRLSKHEFMTLKGITREMELIHVRCLQKNSAEVRGYNYGGLPFIRLCNCKEG